MKKTLIALMALAGVAMASPLTLDTKYMDKEGNTSSYWEDISSMSGIELGNFDQKTITFYIEVSDLYGADSLADGYTYQLTSISWTGHTQGFFVGGSRTITVSNGETSVSAAYPTSDTSNHKLTATFDTTLNITSASKLTVTIESSNSAENVGMSIVDRTSADTKAGSVTGATWGYVDGEPAYDYIHNQINSQMPINTKGYNDIAIRLTVIPEPATATLSLLALAGLAARRRRK